MSHCRMGGVRCPHQSKRQQPVSSTIANQWLLPCPRTFNLHFKRCNVHKMCSHAVRKDQELGSGLDPMLEAAVPADQRPVNELASLKESWMYSWAIQDVQTYLKKLAVIYLGFTSVIGGPIAYQTFDPAQQPLEFLLSASTGGLLVVALAAVRIYLGWSYVGERLFSAAVPYEETGWYDGQVFVKPPEVLTRDRLLGTYEVKPVLAKLRRTLLGAGGLLLVVSVLLFGLIKSGTDADGVYGRGSNRAPRQITSEGVLYSKRVRDLSQLVDDDELAAEEALAQKGMPGYCGDRMLRAFAGGQYCSKFDR